MRSGPLAQEDGISSPGQGALSVSQQQRPSFSELLTRVRDIAEQAFSHQDVPFEILLEHLPLERDLSRNPVFRVAFCLRQARVDSCWAGGVSAANTAKSRGPGLDR